MKQSLGANTYLFPTPVLLIGTYDQHGAPNMMTAAWGGICCGKPPCVNVSLRKATYSYHCLMERKAFTVGISQESQVAETDYCGIATGRKVNKFDEIGFTAVHSQLVDAPYAAEIPYVLECKLVESMDLGLHTIFIGEVLDVKADQSILDTGGMPDIEKLQPFSYDPAKRMYYRTGSQLAKSHSIGKTIGSY